MNPTWMLLLAMWLIVLSLGWRLLRRSSDRARSRTRLEGENHLATRTVTQMPEPQRGWLAEWLYLAGYRGPGAARGFVAVTALLALIGVSIAYGLWARGLIAAGLRLSGSIPGGIGDLLIPFLYAGPWLVALSLTALPWTAVQSARRRRMESFEEDLPVTLELLATLSEAGLGFDAALARVLDSQPNERPLAEELRGLQADIMAARPRVEGFRRLARRVRVPAFSIFVSAVVQAEQIGAGIASVLRRQADDLRARRREDAMALAMSLPIKRLFPMAICFMPGIFVVTLGPTFMEFFRFAEGFIRSN